MSEQVEQVILRPALAVLIVRLVGLGLVILLFQLLLGFFFLMLGNIFSGFDWISDNRPLYYFLGLVVFAIVGFVLYKQWESRVYTIRRNGVIIERGWLIRDKRSLDMNQFGGANVEQSLIGKIFKYGSIRLLFNGAVGKIAGVNIADVSDPFENYQMMIELVRGQQVTSSAEGAANE